MKTHKNDAGSGQEGTVSRTIFM